MTDVVKEFYIRHFRMLVEQAVLALGKAEVRTIVDEAGE